jgi:uncharacterized membrane protein
VEIQKLMVVLAQILYLTLLLQLVAVVVENHLQTALLEALAVEAVVILELVVLAIRHQLLHHKEIMVAMPLLLEAVEVVVLVQ